MWAIERVRRRPIPLTFSLEGQELAENGLDAMKKNPSGIERQGQNTIQKKTGKKGKPAKNRGALQKDLWIKKS